MQFKRPGWAASSLRAPNKYYPRRSDLIYFFGFATVDPYIHNIIRLDLEDDPSCMEPELDIDMMATRPPEYRVESEATVNIRQCAAITLVDQNPTKVLVEVEV